MNRRMDRSCYLFLFCFVLFYFLFTDFCRKTKAKNSFLYCLYKSIYNVITEND